MISLYLLWLSARMLVPTPPPPTVSIPPGEQPKNVRPWQPDAKPTTPATPKDSQ